MAVDRLRRRLPKVLLATVTIVALVACVSSQRTGEDPFPRFATEPVAPTPPDGCGEPVAACRYVGALASEHTHLLEEALDLVVEGSPAYAFLLYYLTSVEAFLEEAVLVGADREPVELISAGDGYRMCFERRCTLFDGFTYDGGLLTDLRVDGEPVGPRLTLGTGEPVSWNSVSAELLVAYQAVDLQDALVVNVRLETTGFETRPDVDSSVYRSPDGTERRASHAVGPFEIAAGSYGYLSLTFEGVEPGGEVILHGCMHRCGLDYTITIPVG